MIRLDHLAIPVRDVRRSREWYIGHFGFTVDVDIPERNTVGLTDDGDVTLFLEQVAGDVVPSCKFALQVDDVEATFRALSSRGVVYVWDERSMRERGGS